MMNRRGILGMLMGGLTSAASGARPSDLIEGMKGLPNVEGSGDAMDCHATMLGSPVGEQPEWWNKAMDALISAENKLDQSRHQQLPEHIASRKSWSQAFKHSEAIKEYQALREARDRLYRNDEAAKRIARLLGVKV